MNIGEPAFFSVSSFKRQISAVQMKNHQKLQQSFNGLDELEHQRCLTLDST
jgi:hypothetical protein